METEATNGDLKGQGKKAIKVKDKHLGQKPEGLGAAQVGFNALFSELLRKSETRIAHQCGDPAEWGTTHIST